MRADGIFIAVEVDDQAAAGAALAVKLSDACPVDIFAQAQSGGVSIVEKNLDECVLCELCINAAPAGVVRVLKLYSGESLPA